MLFAGGCSKTPTSDLRPPTSSPTAPTPLAPDTVLRVHWAGKQTLGVAASSYSFMRLWNLQEGGQLEMQLLEKLSTRPWRTVANQPPAAGNGSGALQLLVHDVLNKESCLEIRAAKGQPEQLVLAIRLNDARAVMLERDLGQVLSSLEGGYPTKRMGVWSLKSPRSQTSYELERVGDWVVFGATKGTNELLQEIVGRIGREKVPFTTTPKAHWLTVEADLGWVKSEVGGQRSEVAGALPRISLLITGDGASTVTTGELIFPQPLALDLEPWNFPKNQVKGPVVGFSAVRGIGPWLSGSKAWSDFKLGRAPNQIFTWAEARAPLQMHFAAPSAAAAETTKALGETFATRANAWLAQHALGSIARWPDATGVVWKDLPMIAPYLTATNPGWLAGGMSASPLPDANVPAIYPRPALDELLADIASRTNLVAYEWETTGARAESVHIFGQVMRAIMRHPQMPANTTSSEWLETARNRLGNCTTVITLAAPNQLVFERKSTTGFNALELHAIADWMESPEFPRGFYSTLSPVGEALKPVGK